MDEMKERPEKSKVMTVDDQREVTIHLKIVLERSGLFEVDSYDNPILALANFKPDQYEVVIVDVRMPDIDGFALYKKIKTIDKKIKICFLTSGYDLEYYYNMLYSDLTGVLEKNGDCVIDEPITSDQLIKVINKLLLS
jgi:DNA-binding NtrC family response regulator